MSLLTKTTTQSKSPFYNVNPFVLLGACSSHSYLPRGSFHQYVLHPHVAGGGSWYSPSVSLWRQRAEEADLPGAIWRAEWQRQEGSSGLVCASLCSCRLRSKQPLSFGTSVTDKEVHKWPCSSACALTSTWFNPSEESNAEHSCS